MNGFDMGSISVVEPGHEQYDVLDVAETPPSRHQSTVFYNEVLEVYNQSEVGTILLVPLPSNMRYYNLRNVFSHRGLRPGKDVLVARQETNAKGDLLPRGQRPVKLKKLTDRKARLIDTLSQGSDDVDRQASAIAGDA